MAKDWERLGGETGQKVDTSRLGRAMRLGRLAGRFAGSALKAGLTRRGDDEGDQLDAVARAAMKNAGHIVDVMGQMKGAAMKIGQMLSADPDLVSPEFAEKLTQLQREAPPMTFQTVTQVIEAALDRPMADVFRFFDPTPLGAASIGQVHRATLDDGRDVAVKVQYPGIAQSLDSDLRNLASLLKLGRVFMSKERAEDFVREARDAILIEAAYTREAANLARFRVLLADREGVIIPEPIADLCRPTVLVMAYVDGRKFDDAITSIEDKERRSALLARFVELFVHMFHDLHELHADPHPGNFMLTANDEIVLLDFGCIRAFRPELTDGVLRMLSAYWADDMDGMAALFRHFHFGRDGMAMPSSDVLRTYHRMILEPLTTDAPFNFSTFAVHAKARDFVLRHPNLMRMVPPAEMLLYLRVVAGLKGMLTRVDGEVNLRGMAEEACRRRGVLA